MRFEARAFAAVVSVCFAIGCSDNLTHEDNHGAYDAGGGGGLSCLPNLDGRIDASEIATVYSMPISYLISPPGVTRPVDLAGKPGDDGNPAWDFGTDYADDKTLTITAETLSGKWYEGSFPNGQFTTPLDAAHTLDAVYASGGDGVDLLGYASVEQAPAAGETLIVYAQPVLVLKLPLTVGTSWTSTGNYSDAMFDGLPVAGTDTYEFADVAAGTLTLTSLQFTQAHRLTSHLTTMPAVGAPTSTRQTSFYFECFGEVARATSQPGETNDDFTTAAELRRLGP